MQYALISVYDKSNLKLLVEYLNKLDIKIIATSGTAKYIENLGFKAIEISEYAGLEESPEGLIKTLNTKIFAGILLNPENPIHKEYMDKNNINPIEIVVVNFYPFQEACKRGFREAIENIDIGGVALARATAKAALLYQKKIIITNPNQYESIVRELEENGTIKPETIRKLAYEAFKNTMTYEINITKYLMEEEKYG